MNDLKNNGASAIPRHSTNRDGEETPDLETEVPVVLPHFRATGTDVRALSNRVVDLSDDQVRLATRCDGLSTVRELSAGLSWPLARVYAALDGLERRRVVLRLAGVSPGPSSAAGAAIHVVIAPHVDDAALSLGGTLALGATPRPTYEVWTVFSRQSFQTGLRVPLAELDRVAEEEERLAGRCLGFRPVLLGRAGAQDRHGWPIRRVMGFTPDRVLSDPVLVRECDEVFDTLVARCRVTKAAVVYAPLGIGGHLDHVLINLAVVRLARSGLLDGADLLFYEDLPYAAAGPVDPIRVRLGARSEPTDVTDASDLKRRALLIYHTRLRRVQIDLCMDYALRLGGGLRYFERVWRFDPSAHELAPHPNDLSSLPAPSVGVSPVPWVLPC